MGVTRQLRLYYYYLVVARTLATRGSPLLELSDGRRVDWARELATRLENLQRPTGNWVNADPSWWEGEPILVTSYALIALTLCEEVKEPPG